MPTTDDYREAAKRKLAPLPDATIPLWSNVQRMADGGAFVECVIFVFDKDVDETKAEKSND